MEKKKSTSLSENYILSEIYRMLDSLSTSSLYEVLIKYCGYMSIKEVTFVSHRSKIIDFILEAPLTGKNNLVRFMSGLVEEGIVKV